MDQSELHSALADPLLDSINFLNEVAGRFPAAISFAAGRPSEDFFTGADIDRYLNRYREHLATTTDEAGIVRALFSYGRTKGLIHREIARYLATDERMEVDPEAVVVTVGAQEAMFLVLRALRRDDRDVALAVSPTYVGFTGAARLVGMPVLPVASGPEGVDLAGLERQLAAARRRGQRPRCLYVIPDFANPTGVCLGVPARHELLRLAEREELLLIEDNPYGTFTGGAERSPTLKSLDTGRVVVYIGSFAKTVLPGARIGFAVADQEVTAGGRRAGYLADELAKLKSMITVNSSPLGQAVVAGRLLENGFRLADANRDLTDLYRRNLELMLRGLRERFPDAPDGGVRWTSPSGGFFLVVTVPLQVDDDLLLRSARDHGVLWTPMRHFYDGAGPGDHQLRLSVSSLTPQDIATGLDRLAKLIEQERA